MRILLTAAAFACVGVSGVMLAQAQSLDALANEYLRLVLALGEHDADYVDAYYGPPELREQVRKEKASLDAIEHRAGALARQLAAAAPPASAEEMIRLRHQYLSRHLDALRARTSILRGRKLTFDEESKGIYDAVSPMIPEAEFTRVLAELERRLPGSGSLTDRYDAFRKGFIVPRERLDATFRAAIDACRGRTVEHVELPRGEAFTLEYVTNKSWSGYNWYQGNYRSLIQINTDLPIYIDRALDLACHEGYPGHHVYHMLIEKNLVRDRGWKEFSVTPLFGPSALISEGSANYGIDVAFPRAERLAFERTVLFPAAGIDPSGAAQYYDVLALVERLSYAGPEAGRRYLNGEIDAKGAAAWLEKYALYSRPRAEQRVRFIDQYRTYVINYNLGEDLVKAYVESRAGSDPARRWHEFVQLISSPRVPSSLSASTHQR